MNRKGFTLVEVLATLAILSIITGIAITAYTSIVESSKLRAFRTYENTMYAEAMNLLIEASTDPSKANYFPRINETKTYELSDLEIEPFRNPRNSNDVCPNSYVKVKRIDFVDDDGAHIDAFEYMVCLICPDSDYNVGLIRDNTESENQFCEKHGAS